jgi:hypothetical protein
MIEERERRLRESRKGCRRKAREGTERIARQISSPESRFMEKGRIVMIGVDGGGRSKKCQEESFQSVRPSSCWGSGDGQEGYYGGKRRVRVSLHRARNYRVFSPQ